MSLTEKFLYQPLCVFVRINRNYLLSTELPKPSLGDLSDLKTLSVRHRRENNPNVLGYNYDELVSLDTVDVELVPEKKGIILKHNEYHVSSRVRSKEERNSYFQRNLSLEV